MAVEKRHKPIILVTHPRACSTAFERIFLTRAQDVVCVHEPFTGAFYFGPERLSDRALEIIEEAGADGKRILVKDFAKCIIPPDGEPSAIVPSLRHAKSEVNGNGRDMKLPETVQLNPTIIPSQTLRTFHFAFLIRSPRLSIPSLYKCSVPPKSALTGWHGFRSKDSGNRELRVFFDYLKGIGHIGRSNACAKETSTAEPDDICVVDADDLLADPERVIKAFCTSVDIPFEPYMICWDKTDDRQRAEALFKDWAPFHDIAIQSTSLMLRPSIDDLDPSVEFAEWVRMFGKMRHEPFSGVSRRILTTTCT
ncbi:uncharacterized protein LY89DRAFT_706239 [Mollisia scopiformis]|uniref:Uncharacterized protein n=1 Tax=Mollisia scopiformis TaxID=149040 RepID=A0A194XHF3_MOLSC|nr:uncharacterized protein LY89DRAFT_706239 [Mollisia scopiformis]KUJ19571.1 hypothetical protein LY89DRAFT_706239 [Mollisia scopiformis]